MIAGEEPVKRAKKWQIIAGSPLHARLHNTLNGYKSESIRVTMTCADSAVTGG